MIRFMVGLLWATLLIITLSFIMYILGLTDVLIDLMRSIYNHELNTNLIQLIITLIVLGITVTSCVLASRLASKKNRSVPFWIAVCIFTNLWGLLFLAFLPRKGS